ncbi:hypothetical protein [Bradyrhizobium guangzhouense]|uniref:Uncharacterized protein n=1 Tax=Bradyrhizobium guangzhouense TaxID=1325095 RepID=A0AAE5WYG1_9BRAD|nr:hypothetical protein [Bradyrhizobium guangzhouense]QAU45448.1 hypothetical protein XH91_08820 [Bradyrhizobium guangzhouense]RXH10937.1 hypothetical protein EAS56_21060 [Bradyrhizobium guangzhouense]
MASTLTFVLGAILGLLAPYFTHRHTINLKIMEQYLEARKLIAKEIAPLTNLKLPTDEAEQKLQELSNKVSTLYYEHYDLLPAEVLRALMLLDVALAGAVDGPLTVRGGNVVKMNPAEVKEFVDKLTMFENFAVVMALSLQSQNRIVRTTQIIRLHARYVLHAMNNFSSINSIFSLKRALAKKPHRSP